MQSINNVIISGNLVRDPEMRYAQSGTAICSVSIAVNENFKKGEEWVKETSYIKTTVFGKQAENLAEYNKKGDPIIIEGRFKQNQWEGKDGKKQSEIVVIANRVHYLKEKDRSGEQGQNQGQTRNGNPKTEAGEPNEQHDETVLF